MKTQTKMMYALMGLTAGVVLFFTAGCSKQQQPAGDNTQTTTPAASEAPKSAEAPNPAAEVGAEAQKAVEATTAATAQAKTAAATAAQRLAGATTNMGGNAVAAADSQVQALIEKAKGLMADQKYKDALKTVQQLAALRLTPEQRRLVDGLKEQIQGALARNLGSDATATLGNGLGSQTER
jgi:hypothetical protein